MSDPVVQDAFAPLLIADHVEHDTFYWRSLAFVRSVTNWDVLAKTDSVHAAISAGSEADEKSKGEAGLALLKAHMVPGPLLDLGCGYGRVAKYVLPERTLDGYVGLDSSIVMLTHFWERYRQSDAERRTPLLLVQSSIDEIPLQDASLGNVNVSAVFLHNHKRTTRRSVSEIIRTLKSGGKLFVISSFPNGASVTGLIGYAYNAFLTLTGQAYKNGPVRYFTAGEVRSLLSAFSHVEVIRSGFEVLPKTIIFFPGKLNAWYRRVISGPINSWLSRHCPSGWRGCFCTHYDVVARK